MDVKLWPLFRYARDDTRGQLRWSAFGPLVEFSRTPETRELRIRPILWLRQQRGARHDDRADILYPLAASRWQDDYQSFRFLLFTYRTTAPAGVEPPPPYEQWTSRLTLLPFVFYRRSPEDGANLSIFPFYLDADDVLGWDHVRAIAFPAYLRLSEPGVERRFYFFPFVSTVGGPLGSGVRVWPFYGETEIAGGADPVRPLAVRHRERPLRRRRGLGAAAVYFPAFATIDGGRTTRGYGMGAYIPPWIRAVASSRPGHRGRSPSASALGETEYRTWRCFRFTVGARAWDRVAVLCLAAYRTKSQDVEDFHYRRHDVGLVLWRRQRLESEASGHDERLLTVFPLLRDASDDGRRHGQTPALADSLLPKNRGVLELWAPLYGLLRWDTRPDGARDWNAGFGFLAREGGRLRGPWYFEADRGD
jgi:hypothetical protein